MSTKKAKKEIVLNEIQAAVVRKYSALNSKSTDAWNSLTAYSQGFMKSAVLFDGSWSDEAIEELNSSLKAMQSKLERKSAGYSTFSSCKAVILKALRAGVENLQQSKHDLDAAAKAAAKAAKGEADGEADGDGDGDGEAAPEAAPKTSPESLIEAALKALIAAGEPAPLKRAQDLLVKAAAKIVNSKIQQ